MYIKVKSFIYNIFSYIDLDKKSKDFQKDAKTKRLEKRPKPPKYPKPGMQIIVVDPDSLTEKDFFHNKY